MGSGHNRASLPFDVGLARGGFMKISPIFAMLIVALTVGMPAAGQTHAALYDIEAPVLEDVQPPLPADDPFQHAPLPSPTPPVRVARQGERIEPGSPAD